MTLVQLINKQIGIKRVVKITKNSEIPSTPKENVNEYSKNQTWLVQNWNDPSDLSKKNHRIKENTKVIQAMVNAIDFKNLEYLNETVIKKIEPNNGIKRMQNNKLFG